MRALKRWFRRRYADYRIKSREQEIAAELSAFFGEPIRLLPVGSFGRDSIYRIEGNGGCLAIMRLANPFKRRAPLPTNSPFVWLDDEARLDREWQAYIRGSAIGIAPKPIWRSTDALVCEYFPWKSLFERFQAEPERFWAFLRHATMGVAKLHEIGLVHMDASLNNILADDDLQRVICIDFEYSPAEFLTVPQQKAYDYLRLLESSVKFCDDRHRDVYQQWAGLLGELVDAETAGADLTPLLPALGRIAGDAGIRSILRTVFERL